MWQLIGGAALWGLAYCGAKSVYERLNRRVKADQIYTQKEVARLLCVTEEEAIELIKSAQLQGQLVAEQYRVMGVSIINFLNTRAVVRDVPQPQDA